MSPDWAFVTLVGVVLVASVVCGIAWKVAFEDGREAGMLHAKNLANHRTLAERRAERSAARTARLEREESDLDQWLESLHEPPELERLARTGELRQLHQAVPADATVTGEFRMLTASRVDAFIARLAAEEDAYRRELAAP